MSDEFKVQWSISLPPCEQYAKGDMLNVRGSSVQEVEEMFDAILADEFVQKATDVSALFLAAHRAQQGLKAAPAPVAAAPAANPAAEQASVSELRVCAHGKMEYKAAFTSRAGKKINASYNCPLGYKNSEACPTQWVD